MADLSAIGRSRNLFKPFNSVTTVNKVMGGWAQQAKENLKKDNKNASFSLSQSIRVETKIFNTSVQFSFIMEDYWPFVDKGRGPGKQPPPEPIIEWVRTKSSFKAKAGLTAGNKSLASRTKSLAFLIGRKIGREGTKGNNFYSDVVNDQSIDALQKQLSRELRKDVEVSVKTIADDVNKGQQSN